MKRNSTTVLNKSAKAMAQNYLNSDLAMYGQSAMRLPKRETVIEIIRDFQKLIFPIYYGERELLRLPPEEYAALMMDRICDKLTAQISMTMEETEENKRKAAAICDKLIAKMPDIQSRVLKDVEASFAGDPAAHSMEEVIFSYPGLFAIYIYRLAHVLYELEVPMIPRIMTEYAHSQTGIDINPGATIGEYFFIDHGTGIVLGETCVIGDNAKLYQGVTLGAMAPAGMEGNPNVRRHPSVGDNVTIYANATLLGGDTVIGDNVVIGSNAFLTESVNSNTKVSIKKPEVRVREK